MKLKLSILTICIVGILWLNAPSTQDADAMPSCHQPSGVMAQDRPREEEPSGNPTHSPDNANCGFWPQGTTTHKCECAKWRKCEGQEPKSCHNFCYKDKCRCENHCV